MSELDRNIVSVSETIDRYCRAWSDPNPASRDELLTGVWAVNATYTDPTVHAEGAQALLAHISRIQTSRPGARVVRTTELDQHHGVVRFGFQALSSDGAVLREGMDIAFLSADGTRIERIIGFFGPLLKPAK